VSSSTFAPSDPRIRLARVRLATRALVRPVENPRMPIGVQRRWSALLARANRVPRETLVSQTMLAGVPAERVEHPGRHGNRVIAFLHGGGYILGSPRAHRVIAAHLANATGAAVYSIGYRLAPENPFPAALDDAVAAYRELAENGETEGIALVGYSAGGGLALATALEARAADLRAPAALALACPWVDLTLSGSSYAANARAESVLTRAWLEDCARRYLAGRAPNDPRCSPLFAHLAGLPPLLIHAAGRDILLSDAERLAERAEAAGTRVELERYEDMWHIFHLHAGELRTSDDAITRISSFLNRARTSPGVAAT
jgi:epsilon-lactone hydrolase